MAVARVTTWSSGQTLTATALNAEFDNLLTPINAILPGSYGTGDLLYASSGTQWAALGAGTQNFVLQMGASIPAWFNLFGTANTWTANQTISNTAPSLVLTDTTGSAKSLTMVVDANLAELRESAGASGSLLVLDLTNNRVGIGTTPTSKLDVNGVIRTGGGSYTSILPETVTNAALVIPNGQYIYWENASGSLRRLIGIDTLNNLDLGAGGSSLYASINIRAGSSGYVSLIPGGGEAVRITSDRNVGIGTTTFGTSAVRVWGQANGTAPTTSPANMVQLWAEDVAASSELRVRDEAGNVTTLSPHPTDILNSLPDTSPFPWLYRSHNDYLGYEVIADMAGLAAAVEQLTGKTFVTYRKIPRRDWATDQQIQVVARQQEIEAALQTKTKARADAEAEADEAKRIEKRREAEAMTIPAPYTPKPAPAWMSRRMAKKRLE